MSSTETLGGIPVPQQILEIVKKEGIEFIENDLNVGSPRKLSLLPLPVKKVYELIKQESRRNSAKPDSSGTDCNVEESNSALSGVLKTRKATCKAKKSLQHRRTLKEVDGPEDSSIITLKGFLAFYRKSVRDREMPPKKSPVRAASPSDIFASPPRPEDAKMKAASTRGNKTPSKVMKNLFKEDAENGEKTNKYGQCSPVRRSARLRKNPEEFSVQGKVIKFELSTKGKSKPTALETKYRNALKDIMEETSAGSENSKLPRESVLSAAVGAGNSGSLLAPISEDPSKKSRSVRGSDINKPTADGDVESSTIQNDMELTLQNVGAGDEQLAVKVDGLQKSSLKKVDQKHHADASDEGSDDDANSSSSTRSYVTIRKKLRKKSSPSSSQSEDADRNEIIPATQHVSIQGHEANKSLMSNTSKSDVSSVLKLSIRSNSVNSSNGDSGVKSESSDKSRGLQLKITDFLRKSHVSKSKPRTKLGLDDPLNSALHELESNKLQRSSNSPRKRASTPIKSPIKPLGKDTSESFYSADIFVSEQAPIKISSPSRTLSIENDMECESQLTPSKMLVNRRAVPVSEESTDSSSDEKSKDPGIGTKTNESEMTPSKMLVNKRVKQDSEESSDSSSDEETKLPVVKTKTSESVKMLVNKRVTEDPEESSDSSSDEKTKLPVVKTKTSKSLKMLVNMRVTEDPEESSDSSSDEKTKLPVVKTKTLESQLTQSEMMVNRRVELVSKESTDSSSDDQTRHPINRVNTSRSQLTQSESKSQPEMLNNRRVEPDSEETTDSSSDEKTKSTVVATKMAEGQVTQSKMLIQPLSKASTDLSSGSKTKVPAIKTKSSNSKLTPSKMFVKQRVKPNSDESTDSSSDEESKSPANKTKTSLSSAPQKQLVVSHSGRKQESSDSDSGEESFNPTMVSTQLPRSLKASKEANKRCPRSGDSESSDSDNHDLPKVSGLRNPKNAAMGNIGSGAKEGKKHASVKKSEESTVNINSDNDDTNGKLDLIRPSHSEGRGKTDKKLTSLKKQERTHSTDSDTDDSRVKLNLTPPSHFEFKPEADKKLTSPKKREKTHSTDSSDTDDSRVKLNLTPSSHSESKTNPGKKPSNTKKQERTRSTGSSDTDDSRVRLNLTPPSHSELKPEADKKLTSPKKLEKTHSTDSSDTDDSRVKLNLTPPPHSEPKTKPCKKPSNTKKQERTHSTVSSDTDDSRGKVNLTPPSHSELKTNPGKNPSNTKKQERTHSTVSSDDSRGKVNLTPPHSEPKTSPGRKPSNTKKQEKTHSTVSSDTDDSRGKLNLTPISNSSYEKKPKNLVPGREDSSGNSGNAEESHGGKTNNSLLREKTKLPFNLVPSGAAVRDGSSLHKDEDEADRGGLGLEKNMMKLNIPVLSHRKEESSDSESDSTDSEDEPARDTTKPTPQKNESVSKAKSSESDSSGSGRLPAYSVPKVKVVGGSSAAKSQMASSDESSDSEDERGISIKPNTNTLEADAKMNTKPSRGSESREGTLARMRKLSDSGAHNQQVKFPRVLTTHRNDSRHQENRSSSEDSNTESVRQIRKPQVTQSKPKSTADVSSEPRKRKADSVSSSDSSDERAKRPTTKKQKVHPTVGHPFDSTRISGDVETYFPGSDISVIQKEPNPQISGQTRTLTGGIFAIPAPVHPKPPASAQRTISQSMSSSKADQSTLKASSIQELLGSGYADLSRRIDFDSTEGLFEEDFLNEDVEVYVVQFPKEVDPKSFVGQKIDLSLSESVISLKNSDGNPYPCDVYCDLSDSDVGLNLVTPSREKKKFSFSYVPVAGRITIAEAVDIPNVPEFDQTTPPRVPFPENLKPRNPFVDSDTLITGNKKKRKYGQTARVATEDHPIFSAEPSEKKRKKSRENDLADETIPKVPDISGIVKEEKKKAKKEKETAVELPVGQVILAENCLENKKKKNKKKRHELEEAISSEAVPEVSQITKEKKKKVKKEEEMVVEPPADQVIPTADSIENKKKKKKEKRHVLEENITVEADPEVAEIIEEKKKKVKKEEEMVVEPSTDQVISTADSIGNKKKKKKKEKRHELEENTSIEAVPDVSEIIEEKKKKMKKEEEMVVEPHADQVIPTADSLESKKRKKKKKKRHDSEHTTTSETDTFAGEKKNRTKKEEEIFSEAPILETTDQHISSAEQREKKKKRRKEKESEDISFAEEGPLVASPKKKRKKERTRD